MEDVRRVAMQLNDLFGNVSISLREVLGLIESHLELVSLDIKLIEGLAASLAVERLVIH